MRISILILTTLIPLTAVEASAAQHRQVAVTVETAPEPLFWAAGADAAPGWPHPTDLVIVVASKPKPGTPLSVEGTPACSSLRDCRLIDDIDNPGRYIRFSTNKLGERTRDALMQCKATLRTHPCIGVVYGHATRNGMTAEQIRWADYPATLRFVPE